MRSSLVVLALAFVLLFSAPALAQTSQNDPAAAGSQYDQYEGVSAPVGPGAARNAVQAAIAASDAIRSSSEEAQAAAGNSASAAELPHVEGKSDLASVGVAQAQDGNPVGVAQAQDEGSPELEKLPDTGGPAPWWLGAPLLGAGGLLARKILL